MIPLKNVLMELYHLTDPGVSWVGEVGMQHCFASIQILIGISVKGGLGLRFGMTSRHGGL